MDPFETEWQTDRDGLTETAFSNVGSGLLVGGGLVSGAAGLSKLSRGGRNLLTEAEHALSARAARDLLDEAPTGKAGSADLSADEIARRGGDDDGASYLRDNSDAITDELADKQARAAQQLFDHYSKLAPLRKTPDEIASIIPSDEHDQVNQARWVLQMRGAVENALQDVPAELAAPIREELGAMGDGEDPAEWFTRASELSDGLLQLHAKAARLGAPAAELVDARSPADALMDAKSMLDEGLSQETVWGQAARLEAQRSAGYAQRHREHLGAFEDGFVFNGKLDPARFRELLQVDGDNPARQSLRETIESARTTADVAAKFGRHQEADAIRAAADQLDRLEGQGNALRAARRTVGSNTPKARMDAAIAFLAAGADGSGGAFGDQVMSTVTGIEPDAAAARLAARGGVFRAVSAFSRGADERMDKAVRRALQQPRNEAQAAATGLRVSAPASAGVTPANFNATVDHIQRMATDPNYFGEVLSQSFGRLNETNPEVYSALARQTGKAVQYLAAAAPATHSGGPFGQRFTPGEDEVWEYNQRVSAATNPEFVARELELGRLSSQAVEAYQVVSPKKFQRLQVQTFAELRRMQQAGIPVPIQAREMIDVLMDIDGGGDPALTWKVAERGYAAKKRQEALSSRLNMPSNQEHASAMTSGALSTLNNGAAAIAQTG